MKDKVDFTVPGSLGLRYAQLIGEVLGVVDLSTSDSAVDLLLKESVPCPCKDASHQPIEKRRGLRVYINSGRLYARAEQSAAGGKGEEPAAYINSGVEVGLLAQANPLEMEAVAQAVESAGLLDPRELAMVSIRLLPEVLKLGSSDLQARFGPLVQLAEGFAPKPPRKEELN